MGPLDAYIVYRFIKTLVTPWDETTAFKRSIIDNHGQKIKTNLNTEDQAAYTLFDRLVFNIKRLIEKIPGGITKIGTYAAALFLIREEMGDEEGNQIRTTFCVDALYFLNVLTNPNFFLLFCESTKEPLTDSR